MNTFKPFPELKIDGVSDIPMKTLLFTEWGPLVRFDGKMIHIEDINPHIETKWNLSRWEMMKLGARLIVAAIRKREA